MQISSGKKKWLKAAGILLIVCAALVAVLYYTIAFRFKESLQFIVNKESNGIYAFDTEELKVSLTNKNIVIKNARFVCKDTLHTTPHYDVKIPDVYLAVASWRELVFQGKLTIDSLAISLPVFSIHEHTKQKEKHMAFHASSIFDALQKAKAKLRIRSFSLQKASFSYGNIYNASRFNSSRISLSVKNFSKDNDPNKNFLSSQDVDLSIIDQQWKLPDGLHEISFTNLHFSGSNQFFEIDSCLFKGKDKNDKAFSISAEKLFFNSTRLADFYNKEELILDTLILYKPIINLETAKKEKSTDSSKVITESFKHLFKLVNFKYIDINGGEIQLTQKLSKQSVFASKGTNLKIYNLLLNENSAGIKVDSIYLQQKNISFVTKDSLFQLDIGEFSIRDNSVYMRNVSYNPTEKNQNTKIFTFSAPLLKLDNVALEDLIAKRLKATDAELYEPQISFKTVKAGSKTKIKAVKKAGSIDKFYTTLHGLSELVAVNNFHIIKGNLDFNSEGTAPLRAKMENINTLVLLDRFFLSDSLIDIKRSLPMVSIGNVSLSSPKVKLHIKDFLFEGQVRHNKAGSFELELATGTQLKGKDLSWVIFDWDRYQNTKQIQVNTMHIKELAVHTVAKAAHIQKEHVAKDLPMIHVDRVDIDKLSFGQSGGNGKIHFDAKQLCIDDINSLKKEFVWNNAEGLFNNVVIDKPNLQATVDKISLNTQSITTIHHAVVHLTSAGNRTQVHIPVITTNAQIHSSGFENINLHSLSIDQPKINIVKTVAIATTPSQSKATEHKQKPMHVIVGKFSVNKGTLHYKDFSKPDSSAFSTGFNLSGEDIEHDEKQLASWKALTATLTTLQSNNNRLGITFPGMNVSLRSGNIRKQEKGIALRSNLAVQWNDASFRLAKQDSLGLKVEKLSGDITDHLVTFSSKEKFDWKSLVNRLNLHQGNLSYKTKKTTISAEDIRYDGAAGRLRMSAFHLVPYTDAATLFKEAIWQTDHITLHTGALDISGIRMGNSNKDSIFKARKVILNEIRLTTIKDKRYPFKHGIEKPMLARLVNNIKFPLDIDSVLIRNGKIWVHEITEKTQKEAIVPLEEVNAIATHVRNRNNAADSLKLNATFRLFSTDARAFKYSESYGDSLSAFKLQVSLSPVILPELSQLTVPFANVSVVNGKADTLFANWVGNKYAAVGKMNFYYKGLKIKVLSKKDSTKSSFISGLESLLANDIALHKKNSSPAMIFFVRDTEKSVFNFWVKTKLNGVIGSAAILQRKKHYKEYIKYKEKYFLPDIE